MSKSHLKGIILDMDGVLTDTRRLHYQAWEITFEDFLTDKNVPSGFSENDYQIYVDGKTREDGIRSFLLSRGVRPGTEEVSELGRKKNEAYLDLLKSADSLVFNDVPEIIAEWRKKNIPMAVITSSKNSREVLKKAGLLDNFNTIVDSNEAEKLGLSGKPSPDYFLEAAKRLGVSPEECTIVEDSIAGIEAGIKGGFHDVVGISREGQTSWQGLIASGADLVVTSLEDVARVPNALSHWEEIELKMKNHELIIFLDYDGTLTEIVDSPDKAFLEKDVRDVLRRLSKGIKVVIVSGRDREDVKGRVGLDDLFYVGCHGLDISGPGCFHFTLDEVTSVLPQLQLATMELISRLALYQGVIIEQKKFSSAIHYRMVNENHQEAVRKAVAEVVARHSRLMLKSGKKVIELLPDIHWDKGTAYRKIRGLLSTSGKLSLPVYIGDDVTDEDVLRIMGHEEIGIRVNGGEGGATWGRYCLHSPAEVKKFLLLIDQYFNGPEKRWIRGS